MKENKLGTVWLHKNDPPFKWCVYFWVDLGEDIGYALIPLDGEIGLPKMVYCINPIATKEPYGDLVKIADSPEEYFAKKRINAAL